ncbi:MAG: hypothetical protein JNL58_03630 [Planctomyces sp.]|nr:hypothetical protein [Planctomyces sp.]
MPENPKMTRRDWFRLRPPRLEPDAQSDAVRISGPEADGNSTSQSHDTLGQSHNTLQPVSQPANHAGLNLEELPPMREAMLSAEQVQQLFADIELLGSDILLMQRLPQSQRSSVSSTATAEQLRLAQSTLLTGTIPRVQIRYAWQSVNWIDTLERRDDGIRLVRIKHTPLAAAK